MIFVNFHVVHPYSIIDITAARKKFHFILLDRSDFHMIEPIDSTPSKITNI